MKVLANDGISASGIAAIEASGHELITTKVAQEQLQNYINEHRLMLFWYALQPQYEKN